MSRSMYFIEARSPGRHVFSAFRLPRLGTVLLATVLRDMGYRTRVFIEDIAGVDWEELRDVPLVGVSTITSTAPRAYRLADRLRKAGKTVVMGGPHPSFLPDEALGHADFVVRGEGEETLVELVGSLEGRLPLSGIKGLSYGSPSGNVHNPDRGFIKDIGAYPAPDFSLVHGWRRRPIVPVATSRGCPFGCRFCSVISMFGRSYRFKPVGRVVEEIRAVHRDGLFVFFVDDNFTADRKRTKELLRRLMAEGLRFEWNAQVRADCAKDEELLGLMKESGCSNVFIGFESVNPGTLELFNKKQDVEDARRAVKGFRKRGIRIHGMFVLGSDTDDLGTMARTERFVRETGMESAQFLMLTPLPGTPVFDELRAQGRLLHTDWEKYDAHHAVFRPLLMSPSELQKGTFKAMARFYSWGSILRHLARLDLYCTMTSYYGKRSVSRSVREGRRYLRELEGAVGKGLPARA